MLVVLTVNKAKGKIIDYTCTDGTVTYKYKKKELEALIKAKKVKNARIEKHNNKTYIRIKLVNNLPTQTFFATHFLMNKNNIVAEINLFTGTLYSIGKLPYGFTNILNWIEKRIKFSCARDARQFFARIGLDDNLKLIDVMHCISLNDTFWLKRLDDPIKWEHVSPFRHDYSNLISTYALEGKIHNLREQNYFSPDISTDGSFPHTWKFNHGNIQFIKAGSKYVLGGRNSGQEPYSEYYASVIAEYLKFNAVNYDLRTHRRIDNKLEEVTVCKCFTTEQIGSVSASMLGLTTYEDVLSFCEKLSFKSLETCLNMFFLDCLLLNVDRHFGNIEFLFDTDTLKIIDIAPIYDNNFSMLPRFIEGVDSFNRNDYTVRDGRTFEALYQLIKSRKDYSKELQLLTKLRLTPPKKVNIDATRLKFLNNFLQSQVKYLRTL